jgi:hypothetical protein
MPVHHHVRALGAAALLTTALQCAHAQGTPQMPPAPESPKTPSGSSKAFPKDTNRQIWFRHLKDVPPDIKTAGLHIEIKGADQMTQRVTKLFSEAGYNMVSADQAKHRYELQGYFTSFGKLKEQVPLAEVLRGVEVQQSTKTTAVKASSDVAFASALADQALKAGLTTPLWASGDILQAILEATGLRDKFNTALTGDSRGACLVGCTYFQWSEQSVSLSWRDPRVDPRRDAGSTMSLVDVGVFAEGMFAEELITLAFNEFLRHHDVLGVPAPEGNAQMPFSKRLEVVTSRAKRTRELIE